MEGTTDDSRKQNPFMDDGEAEAIRFLQESGLGGGRMDPVSFEALKTLMKKEGSPPAMIEQTLSPQKQDSATRTINKMKPETKILAKDLMRLAVKGAPSPLDNTAASSQNRAPTTLLGARIPKDASDRDRLILEQLELQMIMMLRIQQRLDDLTTAVENLSNERDERVDTKRGNLQRSMRTSGSQNNVRATTPRAEPQQRQFRVEYNEQVQRAPVEEAQPQELARQGMPLFTFFSRMLEPLLAVPGRIRRSRTAEVFRAFWTLFRRDVRWNGGPIFKVLIMVALFAAKTMSRKKIKDGWSVDAKFQLVMTLVVLGIMIQCGLPKFLYMFFIKDRYPQRIYAGEEIDLARPPPPPRPRQRQRNIAAGLEQTILGGDIPRADADQGGFLTFFVDFCVLLCSFVLSILPMWKPIGQRAVRRAPRPEIVEVAPPPDLDEHAAEDDEDENNQAPVNE